MNGQKFRDNTLNFYSDNAQAFVDQTINVNMQALYEPFVANLPATNQNQQHVLDLGCGSGRDSLYFADLGFKVTAIDGSAILINLAEKTHNQHSIEWYPFTFDEIPYSNWQKKFTGVWACASLLHVPYLELPALIDDLLNTLIDNGVFYTSFKYGNSERLADKRFFCDMNEDRWQAIKQKLNYSFNDNIWLTEDQRVDKEETWFNVLIRL